MMLEATLEPWDPCRWTPVILAKTLSGGLARQGGSEETRARVVAE
jgi:hypothetical protein